MGAIMNVTWCEFHQSNDKDLYVSYIIVANISPKLCWWVILKYWFCVLFLCTFDKGCFLWWKQNSALLHVLMKGFLRIENLASLFHFQWKRVFKSCLYCCNIVYLNDFYTFCFHTRKQIGNGLQQRMPTTFREVEHLNRCHPQRRCWWHPLRCSIALKVLLTYLLGRLIERQ